MSTYTTEVRYICETAAGLTHSEGFNSIDSILSKTTVKKIFNFDYPIFDENYRYPLNKKILQHFYTREIGEETVGLWKLRLQQTLNEIMPYYNQLYKLELDKINPFYNIDLTTTTEKIGKKKENEGGTKNSTKSSTDTYNENTSKSDTYSKNGDSTDTGWEKTQTNNSKNKTNNETLNGTNNEDITKKTAKNGTETENKKVTNSGEISDSGNTTKKTTDNITTKGDSTNTKTGHQLTDSDKEIDIHTNETGKNTDRFSDTPQGGLNGLEAINQNLYLTNARIVDNNAGKNTHEHDTFHEDVEYKNIKDKGVYNETKKDVESVTGTNKNKRSSKDTESTAGTTTENTNINENGNKKGTTNQTKNANGTENENGSKNTDKNLKNVYTERGNDSGTGNKTGTASQHGTDYTTTSLNTTIDNTENYVQHVVGYKGNKAYAELIIEWRKNLLNIDRMILHDLENCFFQLW